MKTSVNLCWFRRDLRLDDNAALYYALKADKPVIPVFIFDKTILDKLDDKKDARVQFIRDTIVAMQEEMKKLDSSMEVYYGKPEVIYDELLKKYSIHTVFANEDYEPYATERDETIKQKIKKAGGDFLLVKDQTIFSKDEVLKDDGKPYTVFTPYSRKWKSLLKPFFLKSYPTKKYFKNFFKQKPKAIPSLSSMGFEKTDQFIPSETPADAIIKHYATDRDYPGEEGTTRMGLHLRFGTVSIRQLATKAKKLSEVYLNELIWRDFYMMILWHFPQVGKGHAFKPAYERIKWINNEKQFEKWCGGQTGYPMVDAGMRQLNATGFMHNRVRMVTASFLSKHLLIDWHWGEAYFAAKLLDYDLAANNGGWQWAAGCGCDAAPYFRVFNPKLQQEKFDPKGIYIKKWVPEIEDFGYPDPIVEHAMARQRAIDAYQKALAEI